MPVKPHQRRGYAARAEVARAIREGRMLPPQKCEACGVARTVKTSGSGRLPNLVYHHHDYAKPLDVIALCQRCHQHVHHGLIPEPRTGVLYPRGRPARREFSPHAEAI